MVARNRGQLILVGAILIALTIVASAVLLNSVYSSADVQSQQDRQALEKTEQTTQQVQNDLQDLFLINGSEVVGGGKAPFIVDEAGFEALVEEYNRQYLNISTRTDLSLVNMTYVGSGNSDGQVAYSNDTDNWFTKDGTKSQPSINNIFNGNPDYVNYLYVEIVELDDTLPPGSYPLEIDVGTDTIEIDNTPAGYSVKVTSSPPNPPYVECQGTMISETNPLVIETVDGEGQIKTDDETCSVEVGGSVDTTSGRVGFPGGSGLRGQFTVVTADANSPKGQFDPTIDNGFGEIKGLVVEPIFEIRYQNSEVEYSSKYKPFDGDS